MFGKTSPMKAVDDIKKRESKTEQPDLARYTQLDSQFSVISHVQFYEEVNSNPTCLLPSTPDFTIHTNRLCDIVLLEPDRVDQ
jgi:hypothetical protein